MARLNGGYYSLRSRAISTGKYKHTAELDRPLSPLVLRSLNHLQRTAWRVNRRVLDVFKRFVEEGAVVAGLPPVEDYPVPERIPEETWATMTDEAKLDYREDVHRTYEANVGLRGVRATVYRQLDLATELAEYPAIWYPHFLDFRGRVYPLPQGLSTQGDSLAKGLLEFSRGRPLGERGAYWLHVALANAAGFDKAPFDERVKWVEERKLQIMLAAQDPENCLWWADAEEIDSPWEFLALCFEFAGYQQHGERHVMHSPVRLDATCSGIQHLAAMTRDLDSGRAVNLMDTGKREDIYAEVATVAVQIAADRAAAGDELALGWIGNVKRNTVKRAVMTTPYGVTARGIAEQLVNDGFCKPFGRKQQHKAANWLRDVIVDALEDRIGAPRAAMRYFQDVAGACADAEKPLTFRTPSGMVVRQAYWGSHTRRVNTLFGRLQYTVADTELGLIRKKMRQSAAPNVIHAFDAGHLALTVDELAAEGVQDLALIHDSYGTHATDIDLMGRVLRETFHSIYSTNQLEGFRESVRELTGVEDLPEPPALGQLDIGAVLESPFFFS